MNCNLRPGLLTRDGAAALPAASERNWLFTSLLERKLVIAFAYGYTLLLLGKAAVAVHP